MLLTSSISMMIKFGLPMTLPTQITDTNAVNNNMFNTNYNADYRCIRNFSCLTAKIQTVMWVCQ